MSKFVKRLSSEALYIPHVVCLKWENPTFEDFKEVAVYRDSSLAFTYNVNMIGQLPKIYQGTAEKIYDFDHDLPAVTDVNDIPKYFEQTAEEQQNRLAGEQTYKYYIVSIDENNNYYGHENISITVIPTKYYGMGLLMYNDLPDIYLSEDEKIGHPLRRFMLLIGQFLDFMKSVSNINRLLLKPGSCPDSLLPILTEHFGLNYNYDVPPVYQRKFLTQYGDLVETKGTESMLVYMASELTDGYNASLQKTGDKTYNLDISLPPGHPVDFNVQERVLLRYLQEFVPIGYVIDDLILSIGLESQMVDIEHSIINTLSTNYEMKHYERINTYLDGTFKLNGEIYLNGLHYTDQILHHDIEVYEKE